MTSRKPAPTKSKPFSISAMFAGVRVYVAIAIGLVTAEALWWVSVAFSSPTLRTTRLAQFYAWSAVVTLFLALLIGPLYKVFPQIPGKRYAFPARRIIGIGAAWFASLHVFLAYFKIFGGFTNPLRLPSDYQKAFLLGFTALTILLVMAAISFDKAMDRLGAWWYRVQRLIYVAAGAVLLHALMIGSHTSRLAGLASLSLAGAVILVLHLLRFFYHKQRTTAGYIGLLLAVIFFGLALQYGVNRYTLYALQSTSTKAAQ